MIRYLRVVGVDDPYDAACEGWITVVRGLSGFKGDETAWRVWLLACARMRAEEGSLRRSWGSGGSATGGPPDDIHVDSLDGDAELDPEHRGINDTIAAIRALPLGQGEIVMLRLAAELPVGAVADIVGADAAAIRRAEARGIERLGADRELVVWSLAAPPMPAELADERVALGAFRSLPRSSRLSSPRATIVTLGTPFEKRPRRGTSTGAQVVSINGPLTDGERVRHSGHASGGVNGHPLSSVTPLPTTRADSRAAARAGSGVRAVARPGAAVLRAGRSRAALIGMVAASASVLSLSGISAAAFVGVLPDGAQQAMHDLLGAPAPTGSRAGDGGDGSAGAGGGSGPGTRAGGSPVGPAATSSAARGLCQAWSADKAKGAARDTSVAFRNLAAAAGGPDKVDAYCRVATTPTSTKAPNAHAPTAKPGKSSHTPPAAHTPNPNSPTKTSKTSKTANPSSPTRTSKTANPSSPTGTSKGRSGQTVGNQSAGASQQSAPDVAATAPSQLGTTAKNGKGVGSAALNR
jgi:DNA-directed RNA polymerase specialized sigma24 family protein